MKDAAGLKSELCKAMKDAVAKGRSYSRRDPEQLDSLIVNRVKDKLRQYGIKGRSYPVIVPMVSVIEEKN
jgi:hypothetical protein